MQKFDIVGVGIGPANLALIAALLDSRDAGQRIPSALFMERDSRFGWHSEAMLPGSRVQVPFTKDLATQRNPRSRYTFLNFLHEQGRLEDFINLRDLFPEREEFEQYMAWIAAEAKGLVRFSSPVSGLFPILGTAGRVERIGVSVVDAGVSDVVHARCVVLGTGCMPRIPACVRVDSPRIVHSAHLGKRIDFDLWRATPSPSFMIIGAGQSGIEVACHLLHMLPHARVEICLRGHAPRGIDDNPFVNQWYGSRMADTFGGMDEDARRLALTDLGGSNFGVADHNLLAELYRHHYQGLRRGVQRVVWRSAHELTAARLKDDEDGQGVECTLRSMASRAVTQHRVSALILATGYDDAEPPLLSLLDPWLVRDQSGACLPAHDYRLRTRGAIDAAVFLHGTREDRHGPAERSLSTRAVRAGVIWNSLRSALGDYA